jgi:hypothetical protein
LSGNPAFIACLVALLPSVLFAQLPATRLDGVFPAGAAPNSTVEMTISGVDLDDVNQLMFSHEGIKAERKMAEPTPYDEGPQPVPNVFKITLSAVPAADYEVRCQGKYGLSNPRTFVVGALSEIIEVEPNGGNDLPAWTMTDKENTNPAVEVATLPATVNGELTNGPDVDWYRFAGQAGQRVIIEGFARRIDSRADLVLTLYNEAGSILAENRSLQAGDPLLDVTLPGSGLCFLKVHDSQYLSGPGYAYRISLGVLPHLDFVFPPAGLPGSNEEYTVYGRNLPGGQASGLTIDGRPVEMLKVRIPIPRDVADKLQFTTRLDPHQAGLDGIEYRVSSGNATSNPLLMTAATAPVVLDQGDNDKPASPQKLTLPCEVAGQFYPLRDVDWFTFDAKKGEVWSIDVTSHRLGMPSDPMFVLQRVSLNDKLEQVITDVTSVDDVVEQSFNNRSGRHEFDDRTSDPWYTLTAPEDGTYRLMLRDGASAVRSDPRLVYRLAIRTPAPDFRLVAIPAESNASFMLRKGGREAVRITAFRRDGFQGDIRVSAAGLPAGVTSEEITIGPVNSFGTLVLTTAEGATAGVGTLQVIGKSTINGQEVTRQSRYGAAVAPYQFTQPLSNIGSVSARLVNRIQVCVNDKEPAMEMLTIGDGQVRETSRGGTLKIPYALRKTEGSGGNLTGFATDFPPNTQFPQVNIGGNAKGEFEIRFLAAVTPGTYSMSLAGFNQGITYKRNPEEAERAKLRQERISKTLTEAQQNTDALQKVLGEKSNELTQTTNEFNQSTTQEQQVKHGVTAANDVLKLAEAALKQKQEQSAANPSDEALKTQVTQAQAVADDATKKLADAQTAATEAAKKLQEAMQKKGAANEAHQVADKAVKQAVQFQNKTVTEKQKADQYANQKQNEANPRGINVNVPSNTLTIKVTDFPFQVDALADAISIKQGEKLEVLVKVSRKYEFTGAVSVQFQPPGGAGGLNIQNINIPDNVLDGKSEITAAPNATVGEHTYTVRLTINFNGQQLTMERPLKVTVVEVKP